MIVREAVMNLNKYSARVDSNRGKAQEVFLFLPRRRTLMAYSYPDFVTY